MRRVAIGAVLAVLTATAGHLQAIPPDEPFGSAVPVSGPVPAEAKGLIARLGSDDYRAREAAGKALLAFGDRVLPALRDALKTAEDPEVARRIEVLAEKIETDRLVNPRRVTLKANGKTAKDVLTEVCKQAGYTLIYGGGGESEKARFSFEFRDVPFWEALDKVCDAAGMSPSPQNEDGTVGVSYTDSYNPHVAYSGPFRLVATNISTGRNLQLAGLPRRQPTSRQPEYVNLNLNLFSEPKAPIVGMGQPVLTRAVDDTGASMLPPEPDPAQQQVSYYLPQINYRSYNQGFGVNFTRPNQRSTTIKELRGKVAVMILSEVRPEIVVEDVLKAKKKRFAGRTVDLEVVEVGYANDVLSLELTFRRRHGDPDDFNWMNLIAQRLEAADAAGVKFQFNGVNNQNAGPNVVTMQMQFTAPPGKKVGKPARLTLVEWVTVTRDVEFAFKDVPLP